MMTTSFSTKELRVFCNEGRVYFGSKTTGFMLLPPQVARDLARQLLVQADEAEDIRPSHVYQVQAFT